MNYRKDIQCLRGLSVLFVVAYHMSVPGFESGFLGVDIFFVISGFLMAALYVPNKLSDFFLRRAQRLLPAYFVTILLVVIGSAVITLPTEFNQVAEQSIYSAVFLPNLGFWMQNSYFSKAEFTPLMHLWSLGVEIQFYALVPIISLVALRLNFNTYLLLISAAACFWLLSISPKTAFFLLPFRLWEFLLGFQCAKYASNQNSVLVGKDKSWGLAALIVLLLIPSMDVNGQSLGFVSSHPGLYAAIVSCAAAVVLMFGLPQALLLSPVGDILEKLGNYSYSIYLAHYPIIVLFLYQPFSGTNLEPDTHWQIAMLIALIALGSLSLFYYVELPGRAIRLRRLHFALAPGVLLIVVLFGLSAQKFLVPPEQRVIFDAWSDRSTYRCGKLFRILNPGSVTCEITKEVINLKSGILLVGNSHADSIKQTFANVAEARGYEVFFLVPNNPLMTGGLSPQDVVSQAVEVAVRDVVLHFTPQAVAKDRLRELVDLASEKGVRISLILPVPAYNRHIPEAMWLNLTEDLPLPSMTLLEYSEMIEQDLVDLETIGSDMITVYQVGPILCTPICKLATKEGRPAYFDSGHMTESGAIMLEPLFNRLLTDIDIRLGDER